MGSKPHALSAMLRPRSVAVIGASPDTKKLNGELLHFLIEGGYTGDVRPVNPNYKEIHGRPCHADIAAAGGADLALIAIPARAVPAALDQCASAGVKHAVVISSGFAEEGGESASLQTRVAAIARRTGMRISGPNSEGFYNAIDRVAATFSPTVPRSWQREAPIAGAKRIGIVAQSGGMGFAIFNRGVASRLDFSYVITSGNEVDLTMADFVDYLVDDEDTGVIGLFCESIRDAAAFEAAAARALGRKPIVMLKVGQSEAGSRATASHTASIAGWNAAYDAFFAKYGIISTGDVDEAMAACGLLATNSTWSTGRRAAIVTPSGGAGALVSDAMERAGFGVPALSPQLQEKLRPTFPSYGAAQNPIDVTAQGSRSGALVEAVKLVLASDEIDLAICVNSLAAESPLTFDAAELTRAARAAGKPICVYSYTLSSEARRGAMAQAGSMVHTNLAAMAGAMQKILAAAATSKPENLSPKLPSAAAIAETLPGGNRRALTEWDAKRFLRQFSVEASAERLAASAEEALSAAESLGYPVALKIQSESILHKTEVGGVALGIANAAELRDAYRRVLASAGGAPAQGVLVQRMAPRGHEVIVGVFNDPTFGPIVMVGLGGVAVELFRDVAYWPAPVSPTEAENLLRSLKSARLFEGFRGAAPLSLAPLAALVSQVSLIAAAGRDSIAEFELNPVILHGDGSGITIADALIRTK